MYISPFDEINKNVRNQHTEVILYVAEILKNNGNETLNGKQDFKVAINYYHQSVSVFRYFPEGSERLFTEEDINYDCDAQRKETKNLICILFLNLSHCYLKLMDYDNALLTSDQALKLDGKNAKGYFRKAKAFEGKNTLESMALAVNAMELVIKYSSDDEPHLMKILREFTTKLEEKKKEVSLNSKKHTDQHEQSKNSKNQVS